MVAEKNPRCPPPKAFRRDHFCEIESNDNGYCARWLRAIEVRVIYWLGTRAEMLRAFRFDSSVHMMRLMLLRAVTVDPSRCQRQGIDCMRVWDD